MAYERSDLCFGFSSSVLGCSHLGHGSTVHSNIKYPMDMWGSNGNPRLYETYETYKTYERDTEYIPQVNIINSNTCRVSKLDSPLDS